MIDVYNYEGKTLFKISFPNANVISSVPCSVITASTEECFIAGTDHAGPCRQKITKPTRAPGPGSSRVSSLRPGLAGRGLVGSRRC